MKKIFNTRGIQLREQNVYCFPFASYEKAICKVYLNISFSNLGFVLV